MIQKDITVLSVKVDSKLLTEYLHLIKWKGEWKIINVLWEIKPKWRAQWNYGQAEQKATLFGRPFHVVSWDDL